MQGLPSIVSESHSKRHLVFTHGDITMHNIMVQGDIVTGLIDWESAGWFLAHWECIKANFCLAKHECNWQVRLPEIIPPYQLELEADQA
jgi:aminoglycoside phosphotransferase